MQVDGHQSQQPPPCASKDPPAAIATPTATVEAQDTAASTLTTMIAADASITTNSDSTEQHASPSTHSECCCEKFSPSLQCVCSVCSMPFIPSSSTLTGDPPTIANSSLTEAAANRRRVAELGPKMLPLMEEIYSQLQSFSLDKAGWKQQCEAIEKKASAAIRSLFARELALIQERDAVLERARRRGHIIEELTVTEEDYVRDLEVIETVWHARMSQAGVLPPQDVHGLFGNIPQLRFLAGDVAKDLRATSSKTVESQTVGSIFLKKIPFFKLYIEYCMCQGKSSEILKAAAANPKFITFKEEMRKEPATKQLDLSGFLIKPTQRITKYPLFLKDLLKNTETSHADYNNLNTAYKSMVKVLQDINERTREQESFQTLTRMQPSITWKKMVIDLAASKCTVLRSGRADCELVLANASQPIRGNYILLLNHLLLVFNESEDGKYEEVATFKIQDVSVADTPQPPPSSVGGSLATLRAQMMENSVLLKFKGELEGEGFIFADDFLEKTHWSNTIKETLSISPPEPVPLVTSPLPPVAPVVPLPIASLASAQQDGVGNSIGAALSGAVQPSQPASHHASRLKVIRSDEIRDTQSSKTPDADSESSPPHSVSSPVENPEVEKERPSFWRKTFRRSQAVNIVAQEKEKQEKEKLEKEKLEKEKLASQSQQQPASSSPSPQLPQALPSLPQPPPVAVQPPPTAMPQSLPVAVPSVNTSGIAIPTIVVSPQLTKIQAAVSPPTSGDECLSHTPPGGVPSEGRKGRLASGATRKSFAHLVPPPPDPTAADGPLSARTPTVSSSDPTLLGEEPKPISKTVTAPTIYPLSAVLSGLSPVPEPLTEKTKSSSSSSRKKHSSSSSKKKTSGGDSSTGGDPSSGSSSKHKKKVRTGIEVPDEGRPRSVSDSKDDISLQTQIQ